MEQGLVQLRLIKELLATGYDYMELSDFADAYRSIVREHASCETDEIRARWEACATVVGLLAKMRFGAKAWIANLAGPTPYPNITITRE